MGVQKREKKEKQMNGEKKHDGDNDDDGESQRKRRYSDGLLVCEQTHKAMDWIGLDWKKSGLLLHSSLCQYL